jgi:hypothetical protein
VSNIEIHHIYVGIGDKETHKKTVERYRIGGKGEEE